MKLLAAQLERTEGSEQKNSPVQLMRSYGYFNEAWYEPDRLRQLLESEKDNPAWDTPLTFAELTSNNAWFMRHPEKVCGKEVVSSSREFPITIEGTKEDVIRTIRATTRPDTTTATTQKLKLMKLKAKAQLNLQQQRNRNTGGKSLDGLGFLSELGSIGLDGLGELSHETSELIKANTGLIRTLLDRQERQRKYAKGEKIPFSEIIKNYNPGLTEDDIRAWVWYRRSMGTPMTGWDAYFIKSLASSAKPVVATKPASLRPVPTVIKDNHFRDLGTAQPNTVLGTPTKKVLQHGTHKYLIIRLGEKNPLGEPAGSLVYVNESDVVINKPVDNIDDAALTDLVKRGHLFYDNGRLVPYPIYAYGNMYDRELQLNADTDRIVALYGTEIATKHREVIQANKPRMLSIQNIDPKERPKILAISEFAKEFIITNLREESGLDLQQSIRDRIDKIRYERSKAARAEFEEYNNRMADGGVFDYSLQDAFKQWIITLPTTEFKEVTAYAINYYYLDGRPLGKDLSDQEKDTINKYAPLEGEELFFRFLHECVLYEDQLKIDFTWNRTYNAYSSVPYHRVPIGFACSAYFKKSLLQFSPAQREGIAFMEMVGSGIIAYDVGVGKTMTAIITLANKMFSGGSKRPVIAVPNPTYEKWKREIIGFTDKSNGEFIPGVLSHTGITLNDWGNLGVEKLKTVDLTKPVAENSITIVTYEGLMKIGYGKKVMDELFEELVLVLSQIKDTGKSARDMEKTAQKWRSLIGTGNKGTEGDMETIGWDYLVIDEAHNFKNIFDQVPTDDSGRKRYKISGSQSDRGIKAFFLANYIQKTFGRNVMLLTATPFTNSPLEIYSMLSLVGYDSMKRMGIANLETFMETFVLQSLEYVNDHKGDIVMSYVVKSFNNRLVLQRLIHNHIAYKTGEEAGVKRPVKINLPRINARTANGSSVRLPADQQIVTYLRPTAAQRDNQAEIEELASATGRDALGDIGRALNYNLDNALSPYLYQKNLDKMPSAAEFVENSPKINYAVECIASVKKWHEEWGEPVSGQVVYMNRGKAFFPLIQEYLEKVVGYKRNVKHNNKTFNEVEVISSDITGERKEAIKDAFLAGVVKIIIGTATIKEGIDLQAKGTVLYDLYLDWNPTDIKQLEGRIWRQGNEFGYIRVVMPLVQDTMDVFVFQKLEEKTARINDIWYRADRGNVLDQESLDPLEIKFALYSKVEQLAAIRLDQTKKEMNRKYTLVNANIDALVKFNAALSSYRNYQVRCRSYVQPLLTKFSGELAVWDSREASNWYANYNMRVLDPKKRNEVKESFEEMISELQGFQESAELSDKELIRLLLKAGKLYYRVFGATNDYFRYDTDTSEFKQRISEVRKTERTLLVPKGLSIDSDLTALMEEYKTEKAALLKEAEYVQTPEYFQNLMDEVQSGKSRNAITGGSVQQRVEDFKRLNYLLNFKAGDVPADAVGLPDKMAFPAQQSEPAAPADAKTDDKARKLKILKLKAKAQLALQQQRNRNAQFQERQAA